MLSVSGKKKIFFIIISLLIVSFAVYAIFAHFRLRAEKMRKIREAIANPQQVDAESLLNEIDSSFQKLAQNEKNALLENPLETENRIAEATTEQFKKNFELLFLLPATVRKKVIQDAADDLRKKALANPDAVEEIFDSPGGKGVLRGASKFFLLELSGKQKAEMVPMTEAMFEIVKRRADKKVDKDEKD